MAEQTTLGAEFEYIPKPGSKWWHIKNKHEYEVILVANVDAERQDTYPATVVYQRIGDPRIWARPLTCWYSSFVLL